MTKGASAILVAEGGKASKIRDSQARSVKIYIRTLYVWPMAQIKIQASGARRGDC